EEDEQSLEKALLELEEEHQRRENLAEVNAFLREHLDKAYEVNSALKEDVGKLMADWMRAREELELKESEWRNERELYENYVRGEHNRLLRLWREVVTFRRHFLEMKTATDRDLTELKAEQMRLSGAILVNCSHLNPGIGLWESVTLGRPVLRDQAQQQAGQKINQKSEEVMCLQVKEDVEKKELQDRVVELSALLVLSQKENEEKEKTMKTLNSTVELLVCFTCVWEIAQCLLFSLSKEVWLPQERVAKMLTVWEHEAHCHFTLTEPCLCSDCANLEKTREELQQQLEVTEQEASRLRQSNTELQLKEDTAQGEKVEQQQALERAHHDKELLLKDLAALEGKNSYLQSELLIARETLEELHLQRDLLKQEKHELSMALEKAEQSVAELTGAQNKLSAETADLRVATVKMSGINEALALDKVQLNQLVLQVSRVAKDLARSLSLVDKLSLCERANEELSTEKAHLEQLLKKAEEQEEGLRVELRTLAEEKAETQEKLSQVYHQQELARGELEQLRQESCHQEHALAKVSKEKELLVHEKAALEVRLAAVERDRQGLSEQLEEARSVKDTLESRLFEAQQHLSQLEISRSQLEMQLHTVTQAKEVIQGESFMCLVSGEPPAQKIWYNNSSVQYYQATGPFTEEEAEPDGQLQYLAVPLCLQNITEKLQAELQEAQSKIKAVEKQHKEELKTIKEEANVLLQQRSALQKEVTQTAIATPVIKEVVSGWSPSCLSIAKSRLMGAALLLRLCASVFQIESLQEVVLEKEAGLAAREKQLLQDLEESRAGERCLRDSVHVLEAEMSELQLRLCSTENRAKALAVECQQAKSAHCEAQSQLDKLHWVLHRMICDSRDLVTWSSGNDSRKKIQDFELELSERQAERDRFSAHNQELQKQLAQSQEVKSNTKSKHVAMEFLNLFLPVLQHERDRLQAVKEKLAGEIKLLQESVSASEARANTAIDMNHCLEQELQTTLSILKIKTEEVETQREKIQMLQKERSEIKALQETLTHMTAILSEREGEMKLYQEQMRMLENQEEVHKATLDQFIKDITQKTQKVAIQQEQIRELEKQQEMQRTEVRKMGKELQEREQEIRFQQEQIQELEKQQEMQRTEVRKGSKQLEERDLEIRSQKEQIQELEKQQEMQMADMRKVSKQLEERDLEIRSQQEQIQELEKQRELEKIAVSKVGIELQEREQEIRSQQEQIQELKKQQEMWRAEMRKVSKQLEERDLEIRSQQEQIQELEKQQEMQRIAVDKLSKELEKRDQEVKFQEGKIKMLEQHGACQVRNLLLDLDHMKGNLKEKNSELLSLTQQIQELEMHREEVKSLQASLEQLRAGLRDRENECDSQRDQLRLLQQYKEQQEGQLQELHGKVEKMALSLSKKDQELESQQNQMQEVEETMEMQLRTLRDQLDQTLETLKGKDRLIDIQKQQMRSYEEKTEEKLHVLHRDLEYTKAILKDKDACKEKEEKLEAEQTNLQATEVTLKEREKRIGVLEEAVSELQQQKEEAAMQAKAILQKLEHAESSLEAKDQEIMSLQERVQDLQEQKELESKQAKSVEQDLEEMSGMLNEKCLEFLKQTEQMSMLELQGENMKTALASWQKQVNLLEEVVRKRDEDNEALKQKLQHQEEELKTLQNLQLRLTESNEAVRHHREQEKVLEEVLSERERETKAHGEQNELKKEVRALQEDLQHVQQTLTKKDEEIKSQQDRVRNLEETLTGKEQELQRQSELLKQFTSVLKAKGKELERVIAILKQTESGEIEWKEKAQALTLALRKCELANGTLRKEIAILQTAVSERDTDRFHHQVGTMIVSQLKHLERILMMFPINAVTEGEQQSWLSEKRLLSQRLERLQQQVARLEFEKTELKQLNAELRKTLEQVKQAFSACAKGWIFATPSIKQLWMVQTVWACLSSAFCLFQVSLLQTQLAQERKYKQDYIECCAKTSQELSDLHQELSYSLATVLREPKAAVLEAETRKLGQSLNLSLALVPVDHQSPGRQLLHSTSTQKAVSRVEQQTQN
uniref:Rootletin-like coiled-coil domain-containing protein n=1 Tax=Melopsittacus undulatus TaxID=13146 RepID=A0A8V5G4E0_MELUD